MNLKIGGLLALSLLAGPMTTQAGSYAYTTIEYPGADQTQVFGINERAMVAGGAFDAAGSGVGFVYDSRTAIFTLLPSLPGYSTSLLGINEPGVAVGQATDDGTGAQSAFIYDNGTFTIFSHPDSTFTVARAISNKGLVTGYADRPDGTVVGFLYDPATGQFVDFMPSNFTIAQGINERGEIVGSAFLNANEAYPGSPGGNYGFLRGKDGQITLFRVNDISTRARGISSTGTIVGFVADGTGAQQGFVVTLTNRGGFQSLTIPAGDLLVIPGAFQVNPQGIDNSGHISGNFTDQDFRYHGFLAAPTK